MSKTVVYTGSVLLCGIVLGVVCTVCAVYRISPRPVWGVVSTSLDRPLTVRDVETLNEKILLRAKSHGATAFACFTPKAGGMSGFLWVYGVGSENGEWVDDIFKIVGEYHGKADDEE